MKKKYALIGLLVLTSACAERKYLIETISEKYVTVSMHQTPDEEYLTLNIPVEFKLDLNHSEIKYVGIYCEVDNKQLHDVKDYVMVDSKTNRILYAFQDIQYPNYPDAIYLLRRTNKITYEEADALVKQYHPEASLEQIKSRKDTIRLVRYSQYRKDHPDFLTEMRKQPDSLILSIHFTHGRGKLFAEKIIW